MVISILECRSETAAGWLEPSQGWSIETCTVNSEGICSACRGQLQVGLPAALSALTDDSHMLCLSLSLQAILQTPEASTFGLLMADTSLPAHDVD